MKNLIANGTGLFNVELNSDLNSYELKYFTLTNSIIRLEACKNEANLIPEG